ncbi:unnamed protein product, partial [Mycena citricolor]
FLSHYLAQVCALEFAVHGRHARVSRPVAQLGERDADAMPEPRDAFLQRGPTPGGTHFLIDTAGERDTHTHTYTWRCIRTRDQIRRRSDVATRNTEGLTGQSSWRMG